MITIRRVAVIIPAADEQDRIGACLASVAAARRRLRVVRPSVGVDVVVVLDRCTDCTGEIVAAAGVRAVICDLRCVGAARQLGAVTALTRAGGDPSQLWFASTDADSRVPEDWLIMHVTHAEAGAAVVAGTVVPDGTGPAVTRWKAVHDPRAGHGHVHGANLGIRADALLRLGGWPVMPTGEDVALVARAVAAGLVVVSSGDRPVVTSDRRVGRAPKGFSSFLAELDDTDDGSCAVTTGRT